MGPFSVAAAMAAREEEAGERGFQVLSSVA